MSSRACLLHVESLYTWKNYYGIIFKNGRFCNGKDLNTLIHSLNAANKYYSFVVVTNLSNVLCKCPRHQIWYSNIRYRNHSIRQGLCSMHCILELRFPFLGIIGLCRLKRPISCTLTRMLDKILC